MRSPTALAALAAATLTANPALAEDFVYQGSLNDNGQPADGVYDLTFEYYTALNGGTLQLTANRDDVQVTDGVFQVTLPMPPSDDARFLELAVRDGTSTGGYTQLLPRTFIASAPYATKALNVEWDRNMSDFLTFGDGNDVVLINRDVRIGAENFGVGADTDSFGGMYVSTSGLEGFPFYGYDTGFGTGAFAYHYLDGATNELRFNLGFFDLFAMQPDGDFAASGNLIANNLIYNAPQTRSYSVPPAAFKPADMSAGFIPYVAGGSDGAAFIAQSGSTETMVAPVLLPDGATLTSISASLRDGSSARLIQAQLRRVDRDTGNVVVGFVGTTDSEFFTGVRTNPITGSARVVDNDNFSYEIWLTVNSSGWSNVLGAISARWVELEYTVESPD